MPISILDHSIARFTGVSSGATVGPFNTLLANHIVLIVTYDAGCADTAVKDSDDPVDFSAPHNLNTFVPHVEHDGTPAHSLYVRIFDCHAPVGSATHYFRLTGTVGVGVIEAVIVDGIAASGLDDEDDAYDADGGTTPIGITPSEDGMLVLAAVGVGSTQGGTPTVDDVNFAVLDHSEFTGGQAYGLAVAASIQTTATPVSLTWSTTVTGAASVMPVIATYKAAGGGTPVPVFMHLYRQQRS